MPHRSDAQLPSKNKTRSSIGSPLRRSFYERPTLTVAQELIGKVLRYDTPNGVWALRLVEVEAYLGERDPASHAYRGQTARNAVMYGEGGHAYIYFIYGMYYCVNAVTRAKGTASGVLLRAGEIVESPSTGKNDKRTCDPRAAAGPGKLCRLLGLTRAQNGLDLTRGPLTIHDYGMSHARIARTTRIGIRHATEKLWRFIDADSSAVSGKRPRTDLVP